MGYELIPILLPLPLPLLAVAIFSATETALFSLTYHDRLRLNRISPRAARAVGYLMARPRALLILVLFFNMLASTVYFVLTSLALMRSTHPAITIGLGAVNLLAMTLVGEIVSKVLAARYRVEMSRYFAPILYTLFRAMLPAVLLVEKMIIAPLARLVVPEHEAESLTEEELDALLHLGTSEGAIDADERRVLQQVIRFSGLRVRDVMTPRVDMHILHAGVTREEVTRLAREHRLTRIPVTRSLDDVEGEVLGLLNIKKYLLLSARSPSSGAVADGPKITDCLDPVRFVPGSASLDKLLEDFRTTGSKISLAVDEHGSIIGIVSAQDVVQRLITELSHDEDAEQEAQVQLVGLGLWSVPGRLSVREWATMFGGYGGRGLRVSGDGPGARVSTIAGLVFAKLGRVPRVGDSVVIGNLRLKVDSLNGRVVERAIVSLVDGKKSEAHA